MRQSDTLVFFPQNLNSRYSVMYRIDSGQARVLTNRKPTAPIPAVIDLETETRTVNGIVQDVITSGTPTWDFYDIERCQQEINTIGLPAFLRECQHEVKQSKEGLILHNYDDNTHVISYSELPSTAHLTRGRIGTRRYSTIGHARRLRSTLTLPGSSPSVVRTSEYRQSRFMFPCRFQPTKCRKMSRFGFYRRSRRMPRME
jgi:hypothetical protein